MCSGQALPFQSRQWSFIAIIAINSKVLMQLLAAIFPANIAPSAAIKADRFDRPTLQEQT
jgi:hypothetical protein